MLPQTTVHVFKYGRNISYHSALGNNLHPSKSSSSSVKSLNRTLIKLFILAVILAVLCQMLLWTSRNAIETKARNKYPRKVVTFQQNHQFISQCSCSRRYFYLQASTVNEASFQQLLNPKSSCSDPGTFYDSGQKVVSYSLWFDTKNGKRSPQLHERFLEGLRENLQRIRKYYPGYSMRIYTDVKLAREDDYCKFLCENPEVFWCNIRATPIYGDMSALYFRMWRFLVLGDETVDHFLSRDIDSLISAREQAAVNDWLENSTKAIHVMRDYPAHYDTILAGMWGASNSRLEYPLASKLGQSLLIPRIPNFVYPTRFDQNMLRHKIFFKRKSDILAHDSYYCERMRFHTLVRPFPTRRENLWDFVGSFSYMKNNVTKCPVKCRPSYGKDWEYC